MAQKKLIMDPPSCGTKISGWILEDGEPLEKEFKPVKLFPLGKTKFREDFPGGKITFDKKLLKAMADNFASLQAATNGHQLQVNYHHLGGAMMNETAPLESTLAAGWIESLELREDGLYANINWTDRAKAFIQADELKYISPEFSLSYSNRDTGKSQGPTLLGAALTNTPFLKELPRVAAKDEGGSQNMLLEDLVGMLGLTAGATEEEVKDAVGGLMKSKTESEEGKKEMEKGMKDTEAGVVALTESNKKLASRVEKLESEKTEAAIELYLTEKVREGKVTPAQRDGYKKLALTAGLEAIKPICESAQVVKMGEVGVSGAGLPENQTEAAKKLTEIADEFETKHKLSATEAMRRAVRENKALADKASATN